MPQPVTNAPGSPRAGADPAAGRGAPVLRRRVLGGLAAACGVSLLSGCEGSLPASGARGRAALLLPLTGPQAALGQALREAASLGGPTVGAGAEVEVLDAGADEASALRAARAAVDAGARMLIGPLFSGQARAVAGAMGQGTLVVSLSNDDDLAGTGAWVYGITPLHSARAVLTFAAGRGLRDIVVAVPPGAYGERAAAGALRAASEAGVALRPVVSTGDGAALTAAFGGTAPEAVYLPSAGPELSGLVRAARAAGAQVLGSTQWSGLAPAGRTDLDGAWYAAPDPLRFAPFARALQDRGATAGIVAGLVFDAVEMARLLGRLGQQDRRGLLRAKGFNGVLGPYRMLRDGRAERGLAVLGLDGGTVTVLGTPAR